MRENDEENGRKGKIRKSDFANLLTMVGVGIGLVFGFRSYSDFEKLVREEQDERVAADGAILTELAKLDARADRTADALTSHLIESSRRYGKLEELERRMNRR